MDSKKYALHPWHGASVGKDAPFIVNAFIEISKGSKAKFEIDKESGLVKLDRMLHAAVHYPVNYGFIPQTFADDKDPLDILVVCQVDLPPGILCESRIIGMMEMIDKGETDHKLIAVANEDPYFTNVDTWQDLNPHFLKEIHDFFSTYKRLELKPGQTVEVKEFLSKEIAIQTLENCIKQYKNEFDN